MWVNQDWEKDITQEATSSSPHPNSRLGKRETLAWSLIISFEKERWRTHKVYLETLSPLPSWKRSSNISGKTRLSFNQLSTTSCLVDFQFQTFGTTRSRDLPFHHDKWQWLIPDADRNKQKQFPCVHCELRLGLSTLSLSLAWIKNKTKQNTPPAMQLTASLGSSGLCDLPLGVTGVEEPPRI